MMLLQYISVTNYIIAICYFCNDIIAIHYCNQVIAIYQCKYIIAI